MSEEAFQGWAILELMGHRRLGGYVSDVELFGTRMIRLDVPEVDEDGSAPGGVRATQYYSPSSLYALTPCDERTACAVAKRTDPSPVHAWEMPRPALPEGLCDHGTPLDDCNTCAPEEAEVEEPCAACDGIGCDQCEDPRDFPELDDEGRPF